MTPLDDDFGFAGPSAPMSEGVADVGHGVDLSWPAAQMTPLDADLDVAMPKMEAINNEGVFAASFATAAASPSGGSSGSMEGVDANGADFPDALREVMLEGSIGSRTTIGQTPITEHSYHGAIESLRHA